MVKGIKSVLLLALFLVGWRSACAANRPDVLGEAEMRWPGIYYQITFVKRILADRLLVGVRVMATSQAPVGGTLIGFPVPIPPHADPHDVMSGAYRPLPLTLTSSVMIDDLTQVKYSALSPLAPPGRAYVPSETLGFLRPNQSLMMTVQFTVPPPPPAPPFGQPPVKQTVSFLFSNARDFVKKLPVPPPDVSLK